MFQAIDRRPAFDHWPPCLKFFMAKMSLKQFFFLVILFHPVSIFPQILHTHLPFNTFASRRRRVRNLGTFQNCGHITALDRQVL